MNRLILDSLLRESLQKDAKCLTTGLFSDAFREAPQRIVPCFESSPMLKRLMEVEIAEQFVGNCERWVNTYYFNKRLYNKSQTEEQKTRWLNQKMSYYNRFFTDPHTEKHFEVTVEDMVEFFGLEVPQ